MKNRPNELGMTVQQYGTRDTIHALVSASVPACVVAAVVTIRISGFVVYVSRAGDYNRSVAVTVVTWVVVGEVAACEGDADYCEHDCRY